MVGRQRTAGPPPPAVSPPTPCAGDLLPVRLGTASVFFWRAWCPACSRCPHSHLPAASVSPAGIPSPHSVTPSLCPPRHPGLLTQNQQETPEPPWGCPSLSLAPSRGMPQSIPVPVSGCRWGGALTIHHSPQQQEQSEDEDGSRTRPHGCSEEPPTRPRGFAGLGLAFMSSLGPRRAGGRKGKRRGFPQREENIECI